MKIKTIDSTSNRFKIFYGMLYMLAFFYNDSNSIISIVSAFSLILLVSNNSNEMYPIDGKIKNKRLAIGIFVGIAMLFEFYASYILRVFYSDVYFSGSINIGGFEIITSFVLYIQLAVIFIYYVFLNKKNTFHMSKKVILISGLLLLPYTLRESIRVFYGFFVMKGMEIDIVSYANLLFRSFILASLFEECFYRGVIYDELKKHMKISHAQILQSLLFTTAHAQRWIELFQSGNILIFVNLVTVFFLGLCSAKIYEKTNSLIPSILLHGAANGGVYYLVSICVKSLN